MQFLTIPHIAEFYHNTIQDNIYLQLLSVVNINAFEKG